MVVLSRKASGIWQPLLGCQYRVKQEEPSEEVHPYPGWALPRQQDGAKPSIRWWVPTKDSRQLLTWDLGCWLTQQGCLLNCQAAAFWVVRELYKLSPPLLLILEFTLEFETPSLSLQHLLGTPVFLLAESDFASTEPGIKKVLSKC